MDLGLQGLMAFCADYWVVSATAPSAVRLWVAGRPRVVSSDFRGPLPRYWLGRAKVLESPRYLDPPFHQHAGTSAHHRFHHLPFTLNKQGLGTHTQGA